MAAITPRREITIVRSMKRFGLTPLLASATLFLVPAAGALAAAENAASARTQDAGKRFDRDGDGLLDDQERAAAKEALMREQAAAPASSPAAAGPGAGAGAEGFRQRMMEMFDANKDGRLDADERAAAEKFAAERGIGGRGEMREEIVKRFDKNGNGRIDGDEREPAERFMRERLAKAPAPAKREAGDAAALEKVVRSAIEKNEAQLRRFDADKNGKLDDQEWAKVRQEIARWAGGDVSKAAKPTAEEEQKRLEAVAAEVKRRREMREKPKKEKQ